MKIFDHSINLHEIGFQCDTNFVGVMLNQIFIVLSLFRFIIIFASQLLQQQQQNHMEENYKAVELKGVSNEQLIQQFYDLIYDREVEKISIFISFKSQKQKPKSKTSKNLQERTYDAVNSIKERRNYEQLMQNLKVNYIDKNKVSQSANDKINKLYSQGQYEKIIQTLVPRQRQLSGKQNKKSIYPQSQKSNSNNNMEYNFITFSIGNCYFRLKNYEEAKQYYQKTRSDQANRQKAQRLNNLGTCFAIKSEYQQALKAYNEAVRYYNESSVDDVSSILNNIAMIYLKCEMYKTAEEFFEQSIKQRKQKSPNNKNMLYCSYFNLGICQKKNMKSEQSLNNLFIALNYAAEGFGKKIDVLNEICLVYENQQKWAEALSYYEKLSQEYQILRRPQGLIYERVSKIHETLGNSAMAAKFAKKAYKLYFEQGDERKLSQLSGSPLVNMPNTI